MVAEIEVPHHSYTAALTDINVTHLPDTKASPTGDMKVTSSSTGDIEVTLHATDKIKITPPGDTEVTAPASTESYLHTNGEFHRGPNDCFILTRYANQVEFKL